ncbi:MULTISPECIES: hypothetical protein [Streptomyces]|uniref:hypothetical protein n=1 Tax=Streptomyces TaxID=1883 RepID=UPI003663BFF2
MFAAIVSDTEGIAEVLFEDWKPADTDAWLREQFPPFKWDGEAEGDEADVIEEPEYLGNNVHMLHAKQAQNA